MPRSDNGLAFMLKYENVAWYEDGKVKILDRRVYPHQVKFVYCSDYKEVAKAISDMVTQSAGPYTAAGMGMALAAFQSNALPENERANFMREAAYVLSHARPTTISRMKLITDACLQAAEDAVKKGEDPCDTIFQRTLDSIERRYSRMSKTAKFLVDMFPGKGSVMTQCFGETIVGCMGREVVLQNKNIVFYCPETRPYLQGARLTASVLKDQGLDVTVITDNMPAWTIKTKKVDLFTSASDCICMDGNVVNKTGTLQMAITSKFFGIPYFVTGIPDKGKTLTGVLIEERDPLEVLMCNGIKNTMEGVNAYYPAFDITPPHLVSAVVTDCGVYSPYNLASYFDNNTGQYY